MASVTEMTEVQLHAELEKGYADMQAGRTKAARQTFADIRKDYGKGKIRQAKGNAIN